MTGISQHHGKIFLLVRDEVLSWNDKQKEIAFSRNEATKMVRTKQISRRAKFEKRNRKIEKEVNYEIKQIELTREL